MSDQTGSTDCILICFRYGMLWDLAGDADDHREMVLAQANALLTHVGIEV